MVHIKGDIGMENKRPQILYSPTSTQGTEAHKSDKGSNKVHITIIT